MTQEMCIVLTPEQRRSLEALEEALASEGLVTLRGGRGSGKTTVLKYLRASVGGLLVSLRDVFDETGGEPVEETFLQTMEKSLAGHDIVIVDDLHVVTEMVDYPLLLDASLTALLGEASVLRKKMVFATEGQAPWPIRRRAYDWLIDPLETGEVLETAE